MTLGTRALHPSCPSKHLPPKIRISLIIHGMTSNQFYMSSFTSVSLQRGLAYHAQLQKLLRIFLFANGFVMKNPKILAFANSSYEQSWIHDYKLLHELLGWYYSLCNAIGFCLLSSQDNPTKSAHSQDHARNTTWSVFSSRGDIWPGYRCKEMTASGRSLFTYEAGEACQRKSGIGMDTTEDGYRRGWSGWGWSDVYLSIFSLYYCSSFFNLFVWTHLFSQIICFCNTCYCYCLFFFSCGH